MTNPILFANNASTTLAGAITNYAITFNVSAGGGAAFPSPGVGQHFVITLIDSATGLVNEIMWCTNRSGDTFTVVRAQEGTTAKRWLAGDIVTELWTAGQAGSMVQVGGDGAVTPLYIGTDVGSLNTIVAPTVSPTLVSLSDGDIFEITVAFSNTIPSVTADIGGTGVKNVYRADGTALNVGDIGSPPFKALFSYNASGNSYLLQNACTWNSSGGGGGGAIQWTSVFRNANHAESVYNEVIHLTGSSPFTVTLAAPPAFAAVYIIDNASSVTQTVNSASGGFYNTDFVTGGGTQLSIPANGSCQVTSDGSNWSVDWVYVPATVGNRGAMRQASNTEAQNGATSGSVPAGMTPEGVGLYFNNHVANTTTRGISRQATNSEVTNGVTAGSAPAFVTPDQLSLGNPFISTGIGAVLPVFFDFLAGTVFAYPMDQIGLTGSWAYYGGTSSFSITIGVNSFIMRDARWPTSTPPAGTWEVWSASEADGSAGPGLPTSRGVVTFIRIS